MLQLYLSNPDLLMQNKTKQRPLIKIVYKRLEGCALPCHVPKACQLPLQVPGSPGEGLGNVGTGGSKAPTWSSRHSQSGEVKRWQVTPRPHCSERHASPVGTSMSQVSARHSDGRWEPGGLRWGGSSPAERAVVAS